MPACCSCVCVWLLSIHTFSARAPLTRQLPSRRYHSLAAANASFCVHRGMSLRPSFLAMPLQPSQPPQPTLTAPMNLQPTSTAAGHAARRAPRGERGGGRGAVHVGRGGRAAHGAHGGPQRGSSVPQGGSCTNCLPNHRLNRLTNHLGNCHNRFINHPNNRLNRPAAAGGTAGAWAVGAVYGRICRYLSVQLLTFLVDASS